MSLDIDSSFFDEADTVIYTPDGGSASSVSAWVSLSSDKLNLPADGAVIYVSSNDVSSPGYRDKFTIDGDEWRVYQDRDKGLQAHKAGGIWQIVIVNNERFKGFR